jgi:hypothetical protein
MNADAPTAHPSDPRASSMEPHVRPVPFLRLLQVQLRCLRTQRSLLWLTAIALVLGVGVVLFGLRNVGEAPVTAAAVASKVRPWGGGYTLLWLAIAVLGGAAPFRSGFASLVLSMAPRRLRWLAASYASTVVWAVGATIVFGALTAAATAAVLAAGGHPVAASAGVLQALPAVAIKVLLSVTVGFALGAAFRGVAVPLMLGYVGATFIPLLDTAVRGLGRWIDLDAAVGTVAGLTETPTGIGPLTVALFTWIVVPALIAMRLLHRADLR